MARAKQAGDSGPLTIRISTGTIVKITIFILTVVLLYFIRDIVVVFLLALLLSALIDPFAIWISRFKVSRGVSVLIVYSVLIAMCAGIFFLVAPTLKTQTQQMFDHYGSYIVDVAGDNQIVNAFLTGEVFNLEFTELIDAFQQSNIVESLPQIVNVISGTFGVMLGAVLVLVLAFYLVVEDKKLQDGIGMVLPEAYRPFFVYVLPKAKKKTGEWLRGQLLTMFCIFLVTWVILQFVLHLPFALVLAIIAGILEVIPFIGPIISAIPAAIIALSISPVTALLTLLAYFGVQQLEGQVLTPKIMEKVTGINPVFSILAVLVGYELVGPVGAILAIPVAVVAGVVWLEWIEFKKKNV